MDELLEVVSTFYSMEGVPKEAAKSKAEAIFKSLDTNGDGTRVLAGYQNSLL